MTEVITLNTKPKIPNHLNDTNIFCRYGANKVVEVTPKEVCFDGYKLNERNVRELSLVNISDEISRFHIVPPVSQYFKLIYEKPMRLVPGFFVKCQVIFTPDKARIYNDFIKVHTKDHNNHIVVPLYAYPAIEGLKIPRNIKFPATPIGKKCTKNLLLHSNSDFEFEFEIKIVKDHPNIIVEPLIGTIPANGSTNITMLFTPREYVTCEKTIMINVAQYNFQPIMCTISGCSEPGLDKKKLMEKYTADEIISINKLEANRKSLKAKMSMAYPMRFKSKQSQDLVELTDEYKYLKTQFDNKVRDCEAKEKQNKLKWQTKLGDEPLNENDVYALQKQREYALNEYQLRIRNKDHLEEAYKEGKLNTYQWDRTFRLDTDAEINLDQLKTIQLVPECWALRKKHLERFREAVSRIIIYGRWIKRMKCLISTGGFFEEEDNDHMTPGDIDADHLLTFYRPIQSMDESRIVIRQPHIYTNDQWEMSEYIHLAKLPLEVQWNYWKLESPLQYRLMAHERIDTSTLNYAAISSGHDRRAPIVSDKLAMEEADNEAETVIYTNNAEFNPMLYKDRDASLLVYPMCNNYVDHYNNLPLYFYEQNISEESVSSVSQQSRELLYHQQFPFDQLDWRINRSGLLKCKNLIKSNNNNKHIHEALGSFVLDSPIPTMMRSQDMNQLDYKPTEINKDSDPSNLESNLTIDMIAESFSFIQSITEEIQQDWNQ